MTFAIILVMFGIILIGSGVIVFLTYTKPKPVEPVKVRNPGYVTCTSKDHRPDYAVDGMILMETDTEKTYCYDEKHKEWIPLTGKHNIKPKG